MGLYYDMHGILSCSWKTPTFSIPVKSYPSNVICCLEWKTSWIWVAQNTAAHIELLGKGQPPTSAMWAAFPRLEAGKQKQTFSCIFKRSSLIYWVNTMLLGQNSLYTTHNQIDSYCVAERSGLHWWTGLSSCSLLGTIVLEHSQIEGLPSSNGRLHSRKMPSPKIQRISFLCNIFRG